MPPPLSRRQLLALALGSGTLPASTAWSQTPAKRPLANAPRVSADPLVIQTGLSSRWASAMAHDLGWAASFSPAETGTVLDWLEQGQTDVGLFLSHPKADSLDKQGLIYERHVVAQTDVLLVGPNADPAGIKSETDAGRALSQVIVAFDAGKALWQAPPAGSALAALASTLTKGLADKGLNGGAKPAPTGPAYQLLTRASLGKKGVPAGTKVWPIADPRLVLNLEAALSFRSRHQAGKLMVTWLQWPISQNIVGQSQPAWRRVKA